MTMGSSIRGALSYNEQKVRIKDAEMLLASGFSCDINSLGFSEKLRRFQSLNERYEKANTNTLHVSLNFPPDEDLSDEKLRSIALDYMNRIGFAEQPFLVYRHNDANHPHIHIVTNTIRADGTPIQLHKIGEKLSEPARKAIEVEYGLIKAESRKKEIMPLPGSDLIPEEYGKTKVKNYLTNIVGQVAKTYKYSSLEEFNLILRQFNILADRGPESSARYKKGGLVYSFINKKGQKVGVAIKASAIYKNVTLNKLEEKYAANQVSKIYFKDYLKKKISDNLKRSKSVTAFFEGMLRNKIITGMDNDLNGNFKGVYFVDHLNRTVFTQNELGIDLDELLSKMNLSSKAPIVGKTISPSAIWSVMMDFQDHVIRGYSGDLTNHLIGLLFAKEWGQPGPSDSMFKKKKKKKKRL